MTQKYGLVIVDEKDPELQLEQLVGRKCEKIFFNNLNPSKNSKNSLDKTIRNLMDRKNPYLAVYLKAKEEKANIAVIEEKNEYSIKASLYSVPEINPYHPSSLFEGGFGTDHTHKYCLTKGFPSSLEK